MSRPRRDEHARGFSPLACFVVGTLAVVPGCEPRAIVGTYVDGGGRCDPLADGCGAGMACTLRADPAMDACRAAGTLPIGAPCDALDACVPGSQCARVDGDASFDPDQLLSGGICAELCARDAASCPGTQRCIAIESPPGIRVDFGVCAP